ncbi:MAG: DNA polymerase III subunit beta [Rhodospirillaceae bacterium]|nr:MAG: DNA polymerase III subunit beta [Rhodospirillaceae bacterium]
MKLTIERSILLKALGHVQGVVEKRTTIPILANIRLDVGSHGLRLQATDIDLEIAETVPCDPIEPGSTTAPAHTLYDIVRRLPEGSDVHLEYPSKEERLILRSGRSRFVLQCLPVEDFPVMSVGDLAFSFQLRSADLRNLMERTRFAMSTEETRYYLNGLYLHAVREQNVEILRTVATDGHRLARMEVPLPEGAAGMPGIIVPRKTIEEMRPLVEETTNGITLSLSETKIRFAFDETVLVSKLIDGTFPDYERVIPQGNDKVMEVNAKMLADAVNRVSAVMTTDKARAVKLDLTKGNLALSASNTTTADNAEDALEASYDSTPLSIGFNSRYLLDVLGQMTGETVRFILLDPSSPTVVRDAADGSALYVLMPMRV